ncbi:hypothetical protein [Citrobacter amalonaticus]|uniref:Tetratricopeptide repeat protein n=1 Tax=Citrobacter amalonaticus TaxID=35703 RepID=A0A8I0MQT7_CITAM|nr:hypothetical protein [Citrobacter amalonaticus]MBE0131181.1 hypothetical protein [Citrobacter amalonaticus]
MQSSFSKMWPSFFAHHPKVTFKVTTLLLALTSLSTQAGIQFDTGANRMGDGFLIMSGEIMPGDADRLLSTIKTWSDQQKPLPWLYLNSQGGNLIEGYKMMYTVLNYRLNTMVPPGFICYSSCISVFAAGATRVAAPGSRMGVHRVSINGQDDATARSASIDMNEIYRLLKVPDSIRIKMLDADPSDISELSQEEKIAFSNAPADTVAATARVNSSPVKPVVRAVTQSDRKAARDLNAQGISLINQKYYPQAVQVLEQARALMPADAEILGNLGYAYYMAGYLDNAQYALTSALQLKPRRGATWNNLGLVLVARGDISWATEAFVRYWNCSSNKKAATNQFFYWESVRPGTALEQASRMARAQLGLTSPVN